MKLLKNYAHLPLFATLLYVFSNLVTASQYHIELLVDLNKISQQQTSHNWLPPQNHPSKVECFFLAQKNGQISLVDKNTQSNSKTILKMDQGSGFIELSAIAIHPNFSDEGQVGYGVLFTAHTTSLNPDMLENRIITNTNHGDFKYETIITAWQYDFDSEKVTPDSPRVVIQVPIETPHQAIRNMKFDPFQKPWNNDFGHLYFAISSSNSLHQTPLYSGTILKITPVQYGENDYTIPYDNPYPNHPEINQEIVITGLGDIENIFWLKSNSDSIFIQHTLEKEHKISEATLGDNLVKSNVPSLLLSPNNIAPLLYQGRKISALRNKMLFLSLVNNQWHLTSQAFPLSENISPISTVIGNQSSLPTNADTLLHQDLEGALVIFEQRQNKLYSLSSVISHKQQEKSYADIKANQPPTENSNSGRLFTILLAITAIGGFLYFKFRSTPPSKNGFDRDSVKLQYKPSLKTILLFRGKDKTLLKTLALNDIKHCELILNDEIIALVDSQKHNAINNDKSEKLEKYFEKEHFKKIEEDQTRSIELAITDNENSYRAYLYLRIGNSRLTGSKYEEAVELGINLCWDISSVINADNTEKRHVPVPLPQTSTKIKSTFVASKPARKKQTAVEKNISDSAIETSSEKHNLELIEGLDKLVVLHKQGYLSDEEFKLAKTKLLK